MSSAAHALSTPSQAEVFQEIREYSPAMRLYRGHDQWWKFEFAGRDYHVPPDIGGKLTRHPVTDEMVKGDGILSVRDIYGRMQEKGNRKFTGAIGLLEGQEVSAVLMFALTNHSDKGLVWLKGDSTDEARKKASRTMVRNFNKAWAEQQIEARAGFIENFKRFPKNAGKRVPPPSNDQRRAQRLLDSLAEQGAEGYEFVCEHMCSDFDNFEDYARHMRVQHQKAVAAPGTPEPEPEPPTPPALSDEDIDVQDETLVAVLGTAAPTPVAAAAPAKNAKKTAGK